MKTLFVCNILIIGIVTTFGQASPGTPCKETDDCRYRPPRIASYDQVCVKEHYCVNNLLCDNTTNNCTCKPRYRWTPWMNACDNANQKRRYTCSSHISDCKSNMVCRDRSFTAQGDFRCVCPLPDLYWNGELNKCVKEGTIINTKKSTYNEPCSSTTDCIGGQELVCLGSKCVCAEPSVWLDRSCANHNCGIGGCENKMKNVTLKSNATQSNAIQIDVSLVTFLKLCFFKTLWQMI